MEKGNRYTGVSRQDWSFDRMGEKDAARHNDKVKEAIKGNLQDVISDGDIITSDPKSKKIIKIPMKSLELPKFRYGEPKDGLGTGNGDGQPGDPADQGQGNGPGAGDQPGQEYYESELTMEEIQAMVFEDLALPNIKPKAAGEIESEEVNFNDVRKKRTTNNLDMGRTVLQNMMRNAQTGKARLANISPDDYRVRVWEEEMKPENSAVVIAMADISGSMGDNEKYLTRAFCWWTVNFLRTKYPKVEMVFLTHDTDAKEATEEEFFSRSSYGGGTKCSSVNKMALDIMQERYPSDRYNVYPLHFSDGDNYGNDNAECVRLVNELLEKDVNQYAYVQVGRSARSNLFNKYESDIHDDRFKALMVDGKQAVLPALKKVFNPEESVAK
ncbi:MAG TPA: DUF444 family protein [Candidatus Saccharimonadales bacterium]|nr:DUF444 family protein [Candidatus Saccharimonadales bacterium]